MKNRWSISARKVFALFLALSMLLSFLPVMPVAAAEAEEAATQTQVVTAGEPAVSRSALWDFAAANQLADFALYQSATSSFTVSDGMLVPNGTDGEMKAILTNTPSNVRSVSVDIIPGASGQINAGVYVGAANAGSAVNGIDAMVFQIQSNFTGWTDAPNRIDIIQGQFNQSWTELSRTVSEAGNSNALFSGGNKQALNLKLDFGQDVLLLTLSLVSNPNKYLQLMYEVDSAALEGQLGLRVNASDACFDNVQVAYEQTLPENSRLWDFSDAAQAEDFTFYTNGNHSFTVADGMLKSTGGNGEMKAIFAEDMANIAAMSVDIIPGPSGLMNAGVYVGAKNVLADQDKTDAIAVMVESMFSGWDDAPNRIDLWLGKFAQGWGGEVAGSRLVSETGNRNALYAGGVKQPLTLKLEFGEAAMTATLSLQNNPNRFVQKTWTMEAEQLQGQIGLRNQFIDLGYDNLVITYKEPVEQPAPEQQTVYVNDGSLFCQSSLRPWKLTQDLETAPYTVEAWVNAPQGVHDSAVGYIVGNASRAPSVAMLMTAGGKLRLSYKTENADLTVTTRNFDVDTDIRTGKWTHVAYTCDVAADTVVCYLNGQAICTWTEAGLEEITVPDAIVPGNTFAIGSLESSDDAKNKFIGHIADVRLWDRALTAAEVAQSMMTQYEAPREGLLFNAPLAEQVDGVYAELSGNSNPVAPYDAQLDLQTQTHEPGAYSMVVIPDQQILNNYYPEKLMAMYQWIADNREKENIQIVMNVGDMADNCGNITQWENNKAAWELLPEDLPFIAAPGNHDYDTNSGWDQGYGVREQLTLMNEYFPVSLFENYATGCGFFDEENCVNQWQSFEVNGNQYMVIALEYVPQADVLAWANEVVAAHPNHQVIMITHSYVGSYGNLDQPHVWNDFVSKHENIIMAFSGHVWHTSVVRRTDKGVNGNDVHQMLMDAQVTDTGNEGYKHVGMIGLLRFNADGTQCDVSYYSTDRDMYDANSNFTLTLPKQEHEDYAVVGTESFTSVSAAVAAADGQIVELLQSTDEAIVISKDVTIDLAGCELSNVTVEAGYSLKLIDTATDSFGNGGSAAVTGSVESLTQANGKTYVVTAENGVYTAKRYLAALSQQVFLSDDLAMNFVVEADKATTVNVTFNGETVSYDLSTMTADENGKYTLTVNLAAAQMTEQIQVRFVNSGVVTLENTYSVRSYAQAVLEGNYPEKTKNLVKWMLNYGAKAQLHFDVNTDDLANAGYELAETALPTEYDSLSVSGSVSGLRFYGASLVFKNKIAVRFYFTGSVEGVSFGGYEPVQKDGMYYVEVAGINPQQYSELITLTATKGGEALSVSYSPLNYIIRMSQNGSASLKALLNALYGYHAAAVRYVSAIGDDGDVAVAYDAVSGAFDTVTGSGIAVQDGKLAVAGNGEGKVILTQGLSGDKTVSVDIYPGTDNKFNSGIYLGAANAHAPQDAINAAVVMLESHFDASANRLDIVIGSFPAWKEYNRFVIEGAAALFTDNTAEPVNLQVCVAGNELTVTVSLISDPSKSASVTYTYAGGYDLAEGQVGLRSQYNDVSFDNFCVTAGEKQIAYSFDSGDTSGLQLYHSAYCNGIRTTQNDTLALHSSATFQNGTLAASFNTAGKYQAGIVFGSDAEGQNYYLFRLCNNQTVELVKVVNGVETVLDRGYLSAGHNYTKYNRLEVVKNGNTVACYYYNRFGTVNCYAVCEDEAPLTGSHFGFYAANAGTDITDVTVTDNVALRKAETLIFGHSYTEMWLDYKAYFPEYTDIDDIGIGGSVAAHWEVLADEVISYEPKLGVYNIGINDLTGGTTPKAVVDSMEKALLQIKAALPEFEVVLVSVSHCPSRSTITDAISQTNALMRNLAASYDWMYYAETEYLFCTDKTDPLSTDAGLFIDGLHPSAAGYQLMADVIRSAIRGENQPELDEELAASVLAEAKTAKLSSLGIYSQAAYTPENWEQAKPYYEAAVAKINACTTEAELKSVDISAETAALEAIANKSVQIVANLLGADTRDQLNAEGWTKTDGNTANVSGFSYALDNTALYADTEMVFKATNNTGNIATGGIFFRAKQLDNNGILGYLINYVSSGNYLQVYYVNNVYNTDGSAYTLQYIGGINYGAYGSILDTQFYAKVEGDTLILSTVERNQACLAPLTVVDLTYNGQFDLIDSGHMGMLAWNNGVSYDLQLKHFAGETVEQAQTQPDAAQQLVSNLLNSATRTALQADGWTQTDANTARVSGYSYALDNTAVYGDCEFVFQAANNSGVIATGGVFFRATAGANNGVDGYLINYVSDRNFIQVYYLDNVYNTDGSQLKLDYLGGIVYNGNVVGTSFYAKVEGATLYLNTLARQEQGEAALAVVDLTKGGTYELYASGNMGFLAWNEGVSFDLSLQSFAGEQVEDDILKVLAIGNSFSIDGMEYVHQIAQDLGVKKIKLGNLYIGGCSLNTHYSNMQQNNAAYTYYVNTDGYWVAKEAWSIKAALESDQWDVITFQQVSGYSGDADSYDVLPELIAGVKQVRPAAKLGWHMTWAYQSNSTHADFAKYSNDQATMYRAIVSAVQNKILTNEDIDFVIASGTAIENARTSYLGDHLTRDGYHLSYDIGRYIAGIAWAEALTGLDASTLTYRPAGVTEEVMALCIESAKNAAANPYAVTNSQYTLEDCYIELDLNLFSGWYDSTNTSGNPKKVYASTSSLPFYATKVFSKAELPVGTLIVNNAGYNYRPEGWVNGAGVARPATVTTEFVMVNDAWWGDWTERAFNIRVASLDVTAEETEAGFKIYVPLSAYEKVDLSVEKAFYNSYLYPATQTQAASNSLKFFTVQTFTEDTLPVGSIILNTEGRNIRLERWIDGTVKNSDGSRGATSTAQQHIVDGTWWDGFDTRAFNIPVASLEDSEIDALLASFIIYVPKTV